MRPDCAWRQNDEHRAFRYRSSMMRKPRRKQPPPDRIRLGPTRRATGTVCAPIREHLPRAPQFQVGKSPTRRTDPRYFVRSPAGRVSERCVEDVTARAARMAAIGLKPGH